MKYTLKTPIPTLNETIAIAKNQSKGYSPYSMLKRGIESCLIREIKHQTPTDYTIPEKSFFAFTWYAMNRRTDPDNIASGQKYLLDAFVKSEVLQNDNWDFVKSIAHFFQIDSKSPRVVVIITDEQYLTDYTNHREYQEKIWSDHKKGIEIMMKRQGISEMPLIKGKGPRRH